MQVAAHRRGDSAPEVTFTASGSEQVIEAVREGQVELGFIEIRGSTKGLRSRVVARDELVLVVPPDHKWAKRSRPLAAAELDQSFLVSRRSGWRHLLGDPPLSTDDGAAPDVLEFGSAASVRAAVLAGAGPAVMSKLAVREDLAEGRLKAIPVEDIDWRRDLRAIWVGERTPPAGAARELLAHIATGR
jgi:DNA-binding transcriptional LysR family regulator